MMKVYLAVPRAADKLLGHVTIDGKAYRKRVGPGAHVGRVDLVSGRVCEARVGPDWERGHVDLENGKVHSSRVGPDAYIGTVDIDGRNQLHVSLVENDHVGRVDPFIAFPSPTQRRRCYCWRCQPSSRPSRVILRRKRGRKPRGACRLALGYPPRTAARPSP